MDDHTKEAKDREEASRLSVGPLPFPFLYTLTYSPKPDQNRRLGKPCRKFQSLCPSTYVFPQSVISLAALMIIA